ncbi:MAG TPA: CRISPR system precrRNA processing endoribonuclease RAMP protein Cas6 [bacterium]|nr:CRISPR system precrRNA processing endoribonuclease RAMP protein Cas6 [bacterium]HOM27555.1 CRISPR system precrRNA processing endoribonuclease RAMP protein Cas6 [bacterium]
MDFEFIKNLKFIIISFRIQPDKTLTLPFFKGATIRGGLGYSFKKNVCVKNETDCKNCSSFSDCVYVNLFEPKKIKEKIEEIPRPYVIEFPVNKKNVYREDEIFEFNLILFEKAVKYFPYFLISFAYLGEKGIGKFREKFFIKEVFQKYPVEKEIFDFRKGTVEMPEVREYELIEKDIDKISIKFLTPTKIKSQGDFITVPEFEVFIKAVLRRISQILYFWCDFKEKIDYSEIIKEAEKVKIGKCNLYWKDFKRYSTRQKEEMKLGGILGEIEYRGDIGKFYPLIEIGSYIHIGKNTSFGLGKYIILTK